ncbi:hypothetical protein AGABI2DRAFT_194559 [Agaricus bisporus var. bisporus H97]|uniref:hypothetical protein n=1 Tax=Agaricus bisporus var. bisporus (strain H97 / ATCC MYA-4626 / FGSC 10389) TaxID=936046 RepID=UPI00029F5BC1|nr:hypothetical protein AGABI2DRAFT_194559 [Agaricus bisporus var. bisporus H97]EKV44552.1 hypothetical protein AGABI2DRAFT_194559 [Agaricus bisporus var. bisporus H97]
MGVAHQIRQQEDLQLPQLQLLHHLNNNQYYLVVVIEKSSENENNKSIPRHLDPPMLRVSKRKPNNFSRKLPS